MTTATVKKASVRQLTDAQLRGARALVRVDFNVPLDDRGHVMDDTRMRATVPTIEYLIQHGARVVLLSHLGRPKGRPEPQYSLGPVARHLRELIPQKVVFSDSYHGRPKGTTSGILRAPPRLVNGKLFTAPRTVGDRTQRMV